MNMTKRILIAEDDNHIRDGLIDALEQEGFDVTAAVNGREALRFYNEWKPDLLVLDIMMPVKSGYDVCREIRRGNPTIPIIMLTAKGEEIDKVLGLELGADDYVCKPFGLRELMARINAVLRRSELSQSVAVDEKQSGPTELIEFGNIRIEIRKMTGAKGTCPFEITRKELDIIRFFMNHQDEVVHRNDLLAYAWGPDYHGFSRTLDQTIANLRKKLEDDTRNPQYIRTVYGIGYKFTP